MVTFPDQKRIFDCGKCFWMWKNIFLWKIFFIKEISLLLKKFHEQKKNIFLWKYILFLEKFLLAKNFSIKEKHLFIENLFDQENIFVYGKFLWLGKNLDFWNKEKSWLVDKSQFALKFFDHGKVKGLSLLKMKLYNITNTSVKTTAIYISKSCAKTQLA